MYRFWCMGAGTRFAQRSTTNGGKLSALGIRWRIDASTRGGRGLCTASPRARSPLILGNNLRSYCVCNYNCVNGCFRIRASTASDEFGHRQFKHAFNWCTATGSQRNATNQRLRFACLLRGEGKRREDVWSRAKVDMCRDAMPCTRRIAVRLRWTVAPQLATDLLRWQK